MLLSICCGAGVGGCTFAGGGVVGAGTDSAGAGESGAGGNCTAGGGGMVGVGAGVPDRLNWRLDRWRRRGCGQGLPAAGAVPPAVLAPALVEVVASGRVLASSGGAFRVPVRWRAGPPALAPAGLAAAARAAPGGGDAGAFGVCGAWFGTDGASFEPPSNCIWMVGGGSQFASRGRSRMPISTRNSTSACSSNDTRKGWAPSASSPASCRQPVSYSNPATAGNASTPSGPLCVANCLRCHDEWCNAAARAVTV